MQPACNPPSHGRACAGRDGTSAQVPDPPVTATHPARHCLVSLGRLQRAQAAGTYQDDLVIISASGFVDPGDPGSPRTIALVPFPYEQVPGHAASQLDERRGLVTPCLQSMAKMSSSVHCLAWSVLNVHLSTPTSRPVGVGCGCHRGILGQARARRGCAVPSDASQVKDLVGLGRDAGDDHIQCALRWPSIVEPTLI